MNQTRTAIDRRRRLVALIAATALALPVGAVAGAIVTAVGPAVPAFATDPLPPDQAAQAQAMATGQPVDVDADATEFTDTVANPDGSFTLTSNAQPERVRRGGAWVPVDATLDANPDGSLSPAAAIAGLVLSGGGNGPLATFDDGAGHVLSVSMPMPLPAPVVTGDSALYSGVLPGVDLSVTATTAGGISEILIVNDATAAANPALASLQLATTTSGLTLSSDDTGALTATDPATGDAVYTAPPPAMWDSAIGAPIGQVDGLHPLDLGTEPATDPGGGLDDAGNPTTSSVDGPGDAATITTIPATIVPAAIVLTPPTAALTGPGVVYPLYLDPAISGTWSAEAYTQSFHPTRTGYNPSDNLRVGFDNWTTNCGSPCYQNGISRTFLKFTGLAKIDGKAVTAAKLNLTQQSASCSGTYTINAAITTGNAAFTSSTDWNNAPAPSSVKNSAGMSGTNGGKQISLTTIGPYIAAHNYTTLYLELYAASEGDHCTWRHFALKPTMSVTYWSTPNTPTALAEHNGTLPTSCSTASPGSWIAKATSNLITVTENVSTPDASTDLTVNRFVSTNGGSFTNHTATAHETTANTAVPAPALSLTLTDGSSYRWYTTTANVVRTSTAAPAGAPTSTCNFRYDATSPTTPTFSSASYPAQGPSTVTPGGTGTITVTSSDGGTNPSGVATIKYDIDGTGINTGGVTGSKAATSGSAAITVPLADLHWGTNVLWAQAIDTAGNPSTAVAHTFYVQQSAFGPYTPGTAGDIDGDNQPDLVTIDNAGNIRLFSDPEDHSVNPGTPTTDPLQYGGTILISHDQSNDLWPSASFAGALISHNGSFHAHNVDDLIVQHGSILAVLENPSGAGIWTESPLTKPATCATGSDCTGYNSFDWSNVTQMVAVPTGADKAPDLLTTEMVNGAASLWLYTPVTAGTGYADPPAYNPPTLISGYHSDFAWDNQQLIAAGPLPGSAGETLWLRDPATGTVRTIPNITAPIGVDPATIDTIRATGYDNTSHPMLTTVGQADPHGNLLLWSTTVSGSLSDIPTTTTTTGTTTIGTVATVSGASWASHEIALGATYPGYNHSDVAFSNGGNQSFDSTYTYSSDALRAGTLDNGAQIMTITDAGIPNCPTWTQSCPADLDDDPTGQIGQPTISGITGGYQLVTPTADQFTLSASWAHRPDSYQAAGQNIPAPISASATFASNISFLGAAVTTTTITATVTYTDGHTQPVSITLPGWTTTGATGATSVITTTFRANAATGAADNTPTHIFATNDAALTDNGQTLTAANAQVATITLPTNTNVHIFAISIH